MAENNGGTGDSTISPTSAQTKHAATYGYPSHRGSGPSGADIKPSKHTNGNVKP